MGPVSSEGSLRVDEGGERGESEDNETLKKGTCIEIRVVGIDYRGREP